MKTLQEIRKEIDMVEDKSLYYVYFLFKSDGTPFYVGKGKKNRLAAHEYEAKVFLNGKKWKGMNTLKLNTIAKVWGYGEDIFYKIDSWYNTTELAGDRELILVNEIGRKILGTGPLTNIRDGGDVITVEDRKRMAEKIRQFYIDHPEARKAASERLKQHHIDHPETAELISERLKQHHIDHPETAELISERIKQYYIDNPEARDAASQRGIQYYIDNPEAAKEMSDKLKTFCEDHPEFIESLQLAKDNWIENHPDMYAEAEKKRLEICSSDEHREKISGIMKEYFRNNPVALDRLKEQGRNYWVDNEEAKERVKRNNSEHGNHNYLINWYRNDDEDVVRRRQEKFKNHSEWLYEWHRTEEGKIKTLEAAKKRNIKFRTDEHREHMSSKTREYAANNKEEILKTRAKVQVVFDETKKIKEECFRILEDSLLRDGKIKKRVDKIDKDLVYRWKVKGFVPDYFPMYGGLEEWERLLIRLKGDQNA